MDPYQFLYFVPLIRIRIPGPHQSPYGSGSRCGSRPGNHGQKEFGFGYRVRKQNKSFILFFKLTFHSNYFEKIYVIFYPKNVGIGQVVGTFLTYFRGLFTPGGLL